MQKVYFDDSVGNRICGILSVPSQTRALVIMSHGFTSTKKSAIYCELQETFNAQGLGTLRYDYYGHGESDGRFEENTLSRSLNSLQAAIQWVQTQRAYRIGLLGSSFGGLLSLLAAARNPAVLALALKSPVTEPLSFWKERLTPERIQQWEKEGVLHYDDRGEKFDLNYAFWEDLQTHHTLEEAKNIHCPTLIAHGDQDTVVPISQSQTLAKLLHTSVHVVHGADHSYAEPKQYSEVKKAVLDFILQHLR